jgi:quercetin dioxygenase-like cupin family protein
LLASPHGQTVLWSFRDGGSVPPHRHGPQLGIMLAGSMTLLIESEPRHIVAGDYFEIGDGVQHSAVITPGSLIIEIFAQPDLHSARPA